MKELLEQILYDIQNKKYVAAEVHVLEAIEIVEKGVDAYITRIKEEKND